MTFLLPVAYALLLAQTPAPALRGSVWDDASGEPIAGALVVLVEAGRQTRTDSAGRYELGNLPSGKFHLSVSRLGYQLRTLQVLLPAAGELHVDLSLVPLAVQLTRVDINDRRGVNGQQSATPVLVAPIGSRALTHDQVRSNPMLAEPDFILALGTQGDAAAAPESQTMLNVRGGTSDQSLLVLDGVPIYSPVHAFGSFGALNPDALQSIELHGGVAPARLGGALSSVVEVRSRDPGADRLRSRGGASLTSARMLLEGPLGGTGARFIISGRGSSPTLVSGKPDAARLSAWSSDYLGKLTGELAGGSVTFLSALVTDRTGFYSHGPDAPLPVGNGGDSLGAPLAVSAGVARRHGFEWGSSSHALSWKRAFSDRTHFTMQLWKANYEAEVAWASVPAPMTVASSRFTDALESTITITDSHRQTVVGVEMQRDRASYSVHGTEASAAEENSYRLDARLKTIAAFVDETFLLGKRWELMTGARGVAMSGRAAVLEPRVALRFRLLESTSLALGYARTHQTVQSLRNPESVVRGIAGADLPILAGMAGAGVARADQLAAAIETKPFTGLHVALDGYARRLDRLIVVAPGSTRPFVVDGFQSGRGRVTGLALSMDWEHAKVTASSSAAFNRVVTSTDQAAYQPSHAATVMLAAGLAYRRSERTTFRAAVVSRSGRRTTAFEGPLEWEGCNVLKGGCEIVGTPESATGPIGAARLPAYVRLDVGARHLWHARILGQRTVLEGYMTLSNLLDRRNVWAVQTDPNSATTRTAPIRAFSVLNAGIDWRY